MVVQKFVSGILSQDSQAAVVAAGDFIEFSFVKRVQTFMSESGLKDLDEVSGVPELERYSYLFDMNCQELDHTFVSPAIAQRQPKFGHIHTNTWGGGGYSKRISDHDASVAKADFCKAK
jgi:predicted extracellular nuclease